MKKTKEKLIEELENELQGVVDIAREKSLKSSTEPRYQLAYEVGYLSGAIKYALELMKEYKS
jgi:hypothetical protein